MKQIVARHEITRFMREHFGIEAPGDVMRIEISPTSVVVTSIRRDEQGHAFLQDGGPATEQVSIDIRGRL